MTAPATYTRVIPILRVLAALLATALLILTIALAVRREWETVVVLVLILVLAGSAWATGEFDSRGRGGAR